MLPALSHTKPDPEPCGTSNTSKVKASCLKPTNTHHLKEEKLVEEREVGGAIETVPGSEIGDVNNRGSVLLEKPNRSELVRLQLPLRRDHESRGRIHIGDEQGESESKGGAENEQGIESQGKWILGGE